MQVLHLLGRPPDFQTERAIEALSRESAIAARMDRARIGRGVRWSNRVAAVIGLRNIASRYDLLHCWDERALSVAALAGAARIIFSPQEFLRPGGVRLLRAVMHYRDVQVVCPSATLQRLLVGRGIPLERCHLIRPGVDFSRINRRRDPALRAELGIGPDDSVVLAIGESTDAADHFLAGWAMSMLHVMDPRHRFLLWGRGLRADYVARQARKMSQPRLLVFAEEQLRRRVELEELLPMADAGVVSAAGPVAALPIAICMAAALPIVSTATPAVAELLEDRHTALMVPQRRPRLIADKLLSFEEDPELRRRISDTARTEAFEYWSLTKFLEQWRVMYAQLAKGACTVNVPQLAGGT